MSWFNGAPSSPLFLLIKYIIHMLRSIIQRVALFSTEVQKSQVKATTPANITQYKEGQLVNRTALTLKKQEDIEAYVIKTVQNYFRTTYKNGTPFPIQAWPKIVPLPTTAWTPSIPFKLQCKSNKTSATQSQPKHYPPSTAWRTTSHTSSMWRPSRRKITKTP